MMHLTPAQWAIKQFGGVRPLARAAGRSPGAVIRWRDGWNKAVADLLGDIPPGAQRRILQVAKERELDVLAEDLINGRELEAVLAP